MDDKAAVILKKQLLRNLEQLEKEAKRDGKKITQKKSSSGVSVTEAFDVPLEEEASIILARGIPASTSFQGRFPTTVKELIRFSGGLSETINKLMIFRTFDSSDAPKLQSESQSVIDYIDVLEQVLVKAKGLTPQKASSEKNSESSSVVMALPYCALCYKRVYQSLFYCKDHNSNRNAIAYKNAKRSLISAVYRHLDDESVQYQLEIYKSGRYRLDAKTLYRWLALFSIQPREAIPSLNKLEGELAAWQFYADLIVAFASKHFPSAYKLIERLNEQDCSTFEEWIVEVIRLLGGDSEANIWKFKDPELWLHNLDNKQKSLTLLHCLSRYEAFMKVEGFPSSSGVLRGTNIDTEKHARLKKLLEERQKDSSITIDIIASKMGVSRTAVYKMKKRIKL
ncbi:TPA: hypothetical protein RQK50_003201 [Vibrio vulnificus]|nr:hypothetical protein [Vibrio vulnificus]HDY7927735.1 hypothetical protein [Vibrio vulnificus]